MHPSPHPPHHLARQRTAHATEPNAADAPEKAFVDYVADNGFPCVGARSAMNRGRMKTAPLGALGSVQAGPALLSALYAFSAEFPDPGIEPVTFAALFDSVSDSEEEFERLLWAQLQQLHELDREHHGWDAAVSCDPRDANFSFSVGGRGMFVVGLHPHASRLSRRAPSDTLVFNFHSQFEALRESGKYESMQKAVRRRDIALQGSINPVLARFGEASEALQYSGRAAPAKCPFRAAGRVR